MPKLPGRTETRRKIPLNQAWVASFSYPWDKWMKGKVCCIQTCDHRTDQCIGGTTATTAPGPANLVDRKKFEAGHPDPFVGYGCSCCVAKILDLDEDPSHPKVEE